MARLPHIGTASSDQGSAENPRAFDRRVVLAGGGAWLAGHASACRSATRAPEFELDRLLAAHAGVLPERAGAGANHYPMAAEALVALGHPAAIPPGWRAGAAGYAGALPRVAPLPDRNPVEGLGDPQRYGDWLDLFHAELAREPWREVLARHVPRLASGVGAAVFHGLIRTAHATRSLGVRDTRARRDELAAGLAYWATRHAPLVADPGAPALWSPLAELTPRWLEERDEVPFDAVHARLARAPIAPPLANLEPALSPREALDALVCEAAGLLLEMLVLERHRLWLLHTVTGPAAAALLLDALEPADARRLAAYTRQAVAALWIAFGAPCTPAAHRRSAPPDWPELTQRAAASGSVHTIKLIEALLRFRYTDDTLGRSVAIQWLEWV